jgi:hypothetical protein
MKTKWKATNWHVALFCLALLLTGFGCEGFYQDVADPNSGLNVTIDRVGTAAPHIGAGATATGTAWGGIVGGICTAVASAIGIYKNHRNKIVIGDQDAKHKNLETVTRIVVKVIEDNEAIAEKVKPIVKEKLLESEIYKTGKAIISGLKE